MRGLVLLFAAQGLEWFATHAAVVLGLLVRAQVGQESGAVFERFITFLVGPEIQYISIRQSQVNRQRPRQIIRLNTV